MGKRIYQSEARNLQAAKTKTRILDAATKLFQLYGFESVTIEKLAKTAGVSAPTVYSLFQSKLGIVKALLAFPVDQFEALVEKAERATSPKVQLAVTAKIARHIHDNEKSQLEIFRGASVLAPEFRKLEKEKEQQRHKKLKKCVQQMAKQKALLKGLSVSRALAILWSFTSRDMYRMLVIEQGWTSQVYEKWLAKTLVKVLLIP